VNKPERTPVHSAIGGGGLGRLFAYHACVSGRSVFLSSWSVALLVTGEPMYGSVTAICWPFLPGRRPARLESFASVEVVLSKMSRSSESTDVFVWFADGKM